jgi:Tfp pilus assembly protein PilN
MIEINLRPGKRPKRVRFQWRWDGLRSVLATVGNPWLLTAAAAWILVIGGGLAVFVVTRARLAVLNTRLAAVQSEQRRYDIVISQMHAAQRLRDSIVGEINVIRGLDGARYVWPHILDQLTKALPPYVWLSQVNYVPMAVTPDSTSTAGGKGASSLPSVPAFAPVRMTITGYTIDIEAYTTFLRQLAASPWLTRVTPATAMSVTEDNRPVIAFTLEAFYKPADSAYMHVVPFASP